MPSSSDPPASRTFLSLASELGLLSPQALDELAAEASLKHVSPSQLVLQKGLLDATQIDIIETLLRPTDAVPGYEILNLLGRGGMGVVYRARQLNLQRVVALKTVLLSQMGNEAAVKRFEQEARAVARLAHPHIVAAYDFGRHEGRVYFAMELVAGQDVLQLIQRRGRLDEWTAWGIVRQAAAGLAHAAEQGIVHRDIKPANLLLVDPPAGFPLPAGLPLVKIADFGLARLTAGAEEQSRLTAVDMAVGSPHYMAPEQFENFPVDLRADVFALGASAFHMLAGRLPLEGKTLPQIIAYKMSGQTNSVAAIRPEIARDSAELVAAMMAPDPRQRIADYRQLVRRIDALGLQSPATLATAPFSLAPADSPGPTAEMRAQPTERMSGRPRPVTVQRLTIGIGIVAAALLLWGTVADWNSPGERDLIGTGRSADLFNGQDISPWKTLSGGWGPARNGEGALVLQGRGVIRRPILTYSATGAAQPLTHYRLTFFVELHEASAVELQFDLADASAAGPCLLVRLDRQESVFGERTGGQAPPKLTGSRRAHASDAGPLHAIQLERHSHGWWVFVDEQYLASVPFRHPLPAPEFRLLTEGGNAWFSDFTVEELVPGKDADE